MKKQLPEIPTVFMSTFFVFVSPQLGQGFVFKTQTIYDNIKSFDTIPKRFPELGHGALIPFDMAIDSFTVPITLNKMSNKEASEFGEKWFAKCLEHEDKNFVQTKSIYFQKGKRIDFIIDCKNTAEVKADLYSFESMKGYFELSNNETAYKDYSLPIDYNKRIEANPDLSLYEKELLALQLEKETDPMGNLD